VLEDADAPGRRPIDGCRSTRSRPTGAGRSPARAIVVVVGLLAAILYFHGGGW